MDDTGPETGAVFAEAPPFGLEFAFSLCRCKRAGGNAGGAVFFRIKAAEVLPDNL
jgi:hypothetical protein